MKLYEILFFILFNIVISSYIISINFDVNKNNLSIENININLSEVIWYWTIIGITALCLIVFSIVVIVNYKMNNTKLNLSKYNIDKIKNLAIVFFGLVSICSSLIAWEYFGRNGLYNQKNIMIISTIVLIVVFLKSIEFN